MLLKMEQRQFISMRHTLTCIKTLCLYALHTCLVRIEFRSCLLLDVIHPGIIPDMMSRVCRRN